MVNSSFHSIRSERSFQQIRQGRQMQFENLQQQETTLNSTAKQQPAKRTVTGGTGKQSDELQNPLLLRRPDTDERYLINQNLYRVSPYEKTYDYTAQIPDYEVDEHVSHKQKIIEGFSNQIKNKIDQLLNMGFRENLTEM